MPPPPQRHRPRGLPAHHSPPARAFLPPPPQGLLSLHDKCVLHRDIKPKNVFLTGKAHVRLGDLGCAKLMKGGLARTQIGTPYYMSPEIWSNHTYDAKSDMWALGCLLFELAQFE